MIFLCFSIIVFQNLIQCFFFKGYIPIRTPARKLTATPTPGQGTGTPLGFFLQQEEPGAASRLLDAQPKQANLPFMKPEDAQYFDKLLADVDEDSLPPEEQKERKIMKLLLKIKVFMTRNIIY